MSSKSDRVNRSNQLNSNNAAYHSSRSGQYGEDDEDRDGQAWIAKIDPEAIGRAVSEAFRPRKSDPATAYDVERRFLFDFVELAGGIRSFEITARAWSGARDDCVWVAERCFSIVRHALVRRDALPFAFRRVTCADTLKNLIWLCDEFNPERPVWNSGRTEEQKVKEDAMWEKTGKAAVALVKQCAIGMDDHTRHNLGAYTAEQVKDSRFTPMLLNAMRSR